MKIWTLAAAFAAGALLLCGPAAQADNYTVKDSTGATKTICAEDAAGIFATCHVSVNADGSTKIDPATSTLQATANTKLDTLATDLGSPGETACATDTASCSQNQQLQRIAQRLTTAIASALAAGENHTGEVGGNQFTIQVAQTVTAAAYTAGNAVGGKMTLSNAARVSGSAGAAGTGGLLQSVVINSKTAQTTQIDVFVFNSDPSSSTCTDKTAFVLHASDFDKVLGVVHVTDWTAGNTASVGQAQNLAMPYALSSSTTLYACAVTRSAPTYGSTSDISIGFRVLRQ